MSSEHNSDKPNRAVSRHDVLVGGTSLPLRRRRRQGSWCASKLIKSAR